MKKEIKEFIEESEREFEEIIEKYRKPDDYFDLVDGYISLESFLHHRQLKLLEVIKENLPLKYDELPLKPYPTGREDWIDGFNQALVEIKNLLSIGGEGEL